MEVVNQNSNSAGVRNRKPASGARKPKKLCFRQLATNSTPPVQNQRHAPGEAISAGGKILYKTAAEYIGQVLDAVKRRKTFPLKPGFQIVHQIAEEYGRDDQLFSLAIHLDEPSKFPLLHSVNVAVPTAIG